MGCASSKAGGDVAVADVYRPPPTSVSLFDISAVEEPWLIAKQSKAADDGDEDEEEETTTDDEEEEDDDEKQPAAAKTTVVPLPILDKLEGYELAPASWSEVSKALEDMKPVLDSKPPPAPAAAPKKKKIKKKKKTKKKKEQKQLPTTTAAPPVVPSATVADGSDGAGNKKVPPPPSSLSDDSKKPAPPELAGRRVVKDNPFLMRDREESSKGAGDGGARWKRRDPFEGCPERRPPGAAGGGVVLYTTTLRGVRRTFEDCERAREAVEACAAAAGVPAVDERDVSLHAEYLRELRELMVDGAAAPPRLFVMGRYVGGADEIAALAENGKLREMMRWAKARGEACAAKDGRGCEGCGGARFVPCWECGGSCKVVVVVPPATAPTTTATTERCGKCNENGLMMCPICH